MPDDEEDATGGKERPGKPGKKIGEQKRNHSFY